MYIYILSLQNVVINCKLNKSKFLSTFSSSLEHNPQFCTTDRPAHFPLTQIPEVAEQ